MTSLPEAYMQLNGKNSIHGSRLFETLISIPSSILFHRPLKCLSGDFGTALSSNNYIVNNVFSHYLHRIVNWAYNLKAFNVSIVAIQSEYSNGY